MIPKKVMQLITWSFLEGNLKFQNSFLKLLVRIFDRAENRFRGQISTRLVFNMKCMALPKHCLVCSILIS